MGLARALFGRPPTGSGNPNTSGTKIPPSLTAAGERITHQGTDQLRRLIQPWQSRAFSYYDALGEIKYASQFYARMLAPLRLYAAELDDNGDWVETTFEPAVQALERVQDPGGGRESLLSSYGRLMFLAGECYLLCSIGADGDEQWEVLSTDELRIQSGVYIRYKAPQLAAENLHEIPDEDWELNGEKAALAFRLWRRHPRYSMLADSTMMGVLDLCEELLLLTRAVRARARSRLAGTGILAISEDFSHSPLEATGDEDPQVDPFLAALIDAMITPIGNEGAASAVVPVVIRGPSEAVEKGIRHIQIVDPTQLYPETGLRTECIHRIALGLDMPPEILEGLQDSNHWTAWQIDEQTWKAHGLPIANQLVNDLTAAYFRPELRANGVEDYRRYGIAYDPAAIINHPDRSKDAKDLYDRVVIGKRALREATNFDEEDAPTEEERAERIGILVRDGSLAWFGTPAPRGGAVEIAPGEISPDQTGDTETEGATTGAEVEPGPPDDSAAGGKPTSLEAAATNGHRRVSDLEFATKIIGAADLALARAREAAGNRIRSLAKRDPDLVALIEGVPARKVAAVLGQERVESLGVTAKDLVATASQILVETLRLWGLKDDRATLLIDRIERHAARTLYDESPSPLPATFGKYVSGVLEQVT